jgi:hypothetical protein
MPGAGAAKTIMIVVAVLVVAAMLFGMMASVGAIAPQ